MKVRTKEGKVIPLAYSIPVLSGYGVVFWRDIEEFIPEANDIAAGWKDNLKVSK